MIKHTSAVVNLGAVAALLLLFSEIICGHAQTSEAIVPGLFSFGDSTVDVGNNDYIRTVFKANFPPYGRDFVNHEPTGRFCNGKLATDITANTLGFTSYPPPYLSPQASGQKLLTGANFASAGSGYSEKTSNLYQAIPLSQQLQYYKEFQSKLARIVGSSNASSIISGSLYLLSTGTGDYIHNYYKYPTLYKTQFADQFSSVLVGIFTNFVKDMYALGARRIGVVSLPPLGCLPGAIARYGHGTKQCITRLNKDAQNFNTKINVAATSLSKQLPNLKIAVFDIYTPLYELTTTPSKYGFSEARQGCCKTRNVGTTSVLCDPISVMTCANATGYVYWDGVHPSEAANQVIADSMIVQGISLVA